MNPRLNDLNMSKLFDRLRIWLASKMLGERLWYYFLLKIMEGKRLGNIPKEWP